MRKIVQILVLISVIVCFFQTAQAGDIGIGVMVGEPTGLSFKAWAGKTTAFAGGVGWDSSRKDHRNLHVHLDYLLHNYRIFQAQSGRLPLYYGIGGRIIDSAETKIGVRIPIGISYIFPNEFVDIFFELVPTLDLTPDTDFNLGGALGIRFYIL
ncbi:hypothetical protein ACFLRM_06830 [Acidobacteriota bacterium]